MAGECSTAFDVETLPDVVAASAIEELGYFNHPNETNAIIS